MDRSLAKHALRMAIRKALELGEKEEITIEENFEDGVRYHIYVPSIDKSYNYMFFRIYTFPGCCKYCILSSVETYGRFRGKKLSYPLLDLAMAYAKEADYSKVVATTAVPGNSAMEAAFKKKGWKKVDFGKNYNSGNIVTMWVKPTGIVRDADVFRESNA